MAVQRRLAAILAADVAGYSRLMGEHEAGTRANGIWNEISSVCVIYLHFLRWLNARIEGSDNGHDCRRVGFSRV